MRTHSGLLTAAVGGIALLLVLCPGRAMGGEAAVEIPDGWEISESGSTAGIESAPGSPQAKNRYNFRLRLRKLDPPEHVISRAITRAREQVYFVMAKNYLCSDGGGGYGWNCSDWKKRRRYHAVRVSSGWDKKAYHYDHWYTRSRHKIIFYGGASRSKTLELEKTFPDGGIPLP